MKKLFILLITVVANVGTMFAEKVQIGDLWYDLIQEDTTARVTYKSYNYQDKYNKDWDIETVDIPETVTYNDVVYRVTEINYSAFENYRQTM